MKLVNQNLLNKWLLIAVSALGLSGLYSILIVLLRTPGISELLPKDIFKTALIVHVDLSVLVWLLAMGQVVMLYLAPYKIKSPISAYLSFAGIILIFAAPIFNGLPLLNNYVPILHNLIFVLGIALFLVGVVLLAGRFLLTSWWQKRVKDEQLGWQLVIILAVALLCFLIAKQKLAALTNNTVIALESYFELLFWGMGHVLQFFYTQIMLFAWLIMLSNGNKNLLKAPAVKNLLWLNVLFVVPLPVLYFIEGIDSATHQLGFTDHMKYFGGVVPGLLIIWLVVQTYRKKPLIKWQNLPAQLKSSLYASMLLFFCGGMIGLFIRGANTIIPAHYHGSIIGVSIALMGFAYYLLGPESKNFRRRKLAIIQPWLLAVGQLMHITALAISGGYGALRKTPGVELAFEAKLAMGFMGLGGLIAIIGGILFVIIMASNWRLRAK